MAEQKSGPSLNTRLAKAESLLLLALLIDAIISPWILGQIQLQPAWKTLAKMAIIVGCFGPIFRFFGELIDTGLSTTRKITVSKLSMPRMLAHGMIFAALFLGFYWSMHHTLPWNEARLTERRAEIRR